MVSKIHSNVAVEKVSPALTTNAAPAKRAPVVASSAAADSVGSGGTATVATVNEAAPATGANPFAALLATTANVPAAELRLVASADASSESCEPNLAVLGLLAELESHTTPRDAWGPTKVRHGYMQVTYDAQEERAAKLDMDRDASEELARLLVERPASSDARQIIQAQEWRGPASGYFQGGDVNAFVQQVLRECYLLGMTDLQLYGDRLKALNELKKKIREEADRARKVKSEWATAAKGDESWVAPYLYAPVEVDNAQMALIPATYTQEELETSTAHQEGRVVERHDGTAASAADPTGVSLGEGDVAWMGTLGKVKSDKIRNDKALLEKLKSLVPNMSAAQVEELLLPILRNFEKHSHEGGILELVRVMSPEQRLQVAAAGFGSDSDAFWNTPSANSKPVDQFSLAERAEYNQLLVEAAEAMVGAGVIAPSNGLSTAQAKEVLRFYEEKKATAVPVAGNPELSHERLGGRQMGRRELGGAENLAVQKGAQTAATDEEPTTGATKTIDTVAEMDDYLKYLEEQMNSVGDDAQLANIDLQNCLQKQQQTLQMMSNISKVLHDVTMAIIRNMNS